MQAYGARADDLLDDTLAIQKALDAAARYPASTLLLSAGTYHVSDMHPQDATALHIAGVTDLTLQGAGKDRTTILLDSGLDAHVIAVSHSRELTITSLTVDGDRLNHRLGHGIRVAESEGILLEGIAIRRAAHYGIGFQRGTLRRISITGVTVDDTGGDGIDFKNTENRNEQLSIRGVRISRPGQVSPKQAGLDVRGPAEIWAVRVFEVPAGAAGIRFRGDGAQNGLGGHRSKLFDFKVQGDSGSVGVVVDADHVSIDGGLVIGTHTGVLALASDAAIRAVHVEGAKRCAFRIGSGALGTTLTECRGNTSFAGLRVEGDATLARSSTFAKGCGVCVRASADATQLLFNQFAENGVGVDDTGVGTRIEDSSLIYERAGAK